MKRIGTFIACVFSALVIIGCEENLPPARVGDAGGRILERKAVAPKKIAERKQNAEKRIFGNDKLPDWAKAILRKLIDRKYDVKFNDVELSEALGILQKMSGVSIIGDPKAMVDEDGNPKILRFEVKQMTLANILTWICRLTKSGYELKNEAVFVTTEDNIDGEMVTLVYDIRDLQIEIRDFVAPELNLDKLFDNQP